MICPVCKKKYYGKRSKWCSNACYQKSYAQKREKGWHKKYYKPHPLKKKVKTKTPEEEREYRKKYYQEHKEYYKQKNKEYYLQHKDDEDFRKRHNEATKRYFERKRLKGEKWWIKKKN